MDAPVKSISHRFPLWPQWLAATEVLLISMTLGLSVGWITPYLAKFSKPDSQILISKEDASWIASIVCIAAPVGSGLQAILVNKFGSKSAMLTSGVFFALGWMCFFVENSVVSIYAYRILAGTAAGVLYGAFPLYIGEISDPRIRGALISFILQGVMVGSVIGNTMGAYLDTWVFAAISLVPNLLFIIFFLLLPHSSHYLVRHNKLDDAAKSIRWYNRNADVESELAALKKFIHTTNSSSITFTDRIRDLMKPINRKTLLLLFFVYLFFQLSGFYTVTVYMEIMLTKSRVTVVTPANMVIIVNSLGVVFSWMSIYTNDKFGRTVMLILSTTGVAIGLFLWGLNYQLLDLGLDNPHLQWMALIAAIIYKTSLAIGLLTIPSTLMSEMFAPNVKSLGVSVINICSTMFAFIGSRTFQPMVDSLTEKYVFWIYASLMLSAGIYTMVFVPETKGKSLVEIQDLLTTSEKIDKSTSKKYNKGECIQLLNIMTGTPQLPADFLR